MIDIKERRAVNGILTGYFGILGDRIVFLDLGTLGVSLNYLEPPRIMSWEGFLKEEKFNLALPKGVVSLQSPLSHITFMLEAFLIKGRGLDRRHILWYDKSEDNYEPEALETMY